MENVLTLWGLGAFGIACYCFGHWNAWMKWERWTKDDISDETKAKVYGG